ncbi:rme1-like gtpase atpase without a c-terminal eh domain protein [Plasmopara halstedii]|uniref:Rme1-like gtpase atpase without a c-terminal eh domain protein n=1 Tax=Plasmopara halstedii TaxID=4781 RepID=A0A0N7L707_PLAHL|nr:rme1-like gtpase atpase without a c-terminal eh domain protein [Plasmopara halstedii]CEG45747.1 rme1-like gtpase atpase without a c-terminal eh domain protein [Plasmopara halstedii]|eukprot:XP_024582116.1 rme1-like gtpase atpase without a c-terminal eh domain protein [Plasmopara halstedii]
MHQTSRLETKVLLPLNEKLLGPLDRKHREEKLPSLPFVFLLGNHSSGKSSFINYLLQRDVQSTGVAPTDDGFTIIAPGNADLDQDGPALVGDPDLGFSGLRIYGPALIQRTQLKVRKGIQANYMLVDSPGMIDSPQTLPHQLQVGYDANSNRLSNQQQQSNNPKGRVSDRGYDFPEVVRWYAERADVILLFFDPDKPGTTGETLSILTRSLIGMDHKLHLVLNKVDQFRKIHDFARAYGSLCWNLSKVIPLKDLPRIYTMCIPTNDNQMQAAEGLGASMKDLDAMREEVVNEVQRAPERRVDNLITNLYDSSRLLKMHAEVFEDLRVRYASEKWSRSALVAATFVGGNGLAASALFTGVAIEATAGLSILSVLASAGAVWHNSNVMAQLERNLLLEESLSELFRRRYGRQLADGDEYVLSLWKRVLPSLQVAIHTLGFNKLPKLKSSEIGALDNIISSEIPKLRRQCAPTDNSLAHQIAKMLRN